MNAYSNIPQIALAEQSIQRLERYANVPRDLAELVVTESFRSRIPVSDLRSNRYPRDYVAVTRRIAVEARRRGYSYPTIGRALNRDHSTVVHTVKVALRERLAG